jgi:hypothetical protein
MINMAKLQENIDSVVDNTGVSIGKYEDKSTWKVHYIGEPTKEQATQIAAIIEAQLVLTPAQELVQAEAKGYLQSTDWQVVRHLEQVACSHSTSLSVTDFYTLCEKRQKARAQVLV